MRETCAASIKGKWRDLYIGSIKIATGNITGKEEADVLEASQAW